VKNCQTIKPLT